MDNIPFGKSIIWVLDIVAEESPINISRLARKTGLGYKPTKQNIDKLVKIGIIKEILKEKERIIVFNINKLSYHFVKHEGMRVTIE